MKKGIYYKIIIIIVLIFFFFYEVNLYINARVVFVRVLYDDTVFIFFIGPYINDWYDDGWTRGCG